MNTAVTHVLSTLLAVVGAEPAHSQVSITSRVDHAQARVGRNFDPTLKQVMLSRQLLGSVDQTAVVEQSTKDRMAVTMATSVTPTTEGFVATIDRMAIDYSLSHEGQEIGAGLDFILEFELTADAIFSVSVDVDRDPLPIDVSWFSLHHRTEYSATTGMPIFGSDRGVFGSGGDPFGGSLFSAYGHERSGMLNPGSYRLMAIALSSRVYRDSSPQQQSVNGTLINPFSFSVQVIPEPSGFLLWCAFLVSAFQDRRLFDF